MKRISAWLIAAAFITSNPVMAQSNQLLSFDDQVSCEDLVEGYTKCLLEDPGVFLGINSVNRWLIKSNRSGSERVEAIVYDIPVDQKARLMSRLLVLPTNVSRNIKISHGKWTSRVIVVSSDTQ